MRWTGGSQADTDNADVPPDNARLADAAPNRPDCALPDAGPDTGINAGPDTGPGTRQADSDATKPDVIAAAPANLPDDDVLSRKRGARLAIRLLLLILICLAPMVGAQLFVQFDLRQERRAQLGELAMRQAELANSDLVSIVDGTRQLAATVGQFAAALDPACPERMTSLIHDLPNYKFIAFYDAGGHAVCASDPALMAASATHPVWLDDLQHTTTFRIGTYTTAADIDGAFLPMVLPMYPRPEAAKPDPVALVVVALDLGWLKRHLEELRFNRGKLLANAGLAIIDREGSALARLGASGGNEAREVRPEVRALIHNDAAGVTNVVGYDGRDRIVAYIPTTLPPEGLAITAAFYPPDMSADIDTASQREAEFAIGSTILALILSLLAARRFIVRPTERLLTAARQWRQGNLAARADVGESHSEFAALASSFNAMAASLQARELDRRRQATLLEAQVVKRTRELSESNNRLQVEIGERERTEAALHQAQKLQAVGQLAGGIAHDFNNLLATILGNLELMERRVVTGETQYDRMQGLIERATGAVQRGAQLTARLLAFARRQPLAPQPTDLNRLVTDLVALASSTIGRRIQVVTELSPELWPVLVDPSQIEAAILNLCLNARDAMPDGGRITIATANEPAVVTAGVVVAGPCVRLSVIDTGVGMAPEVQRRAFEPFFTTKGPEGSGLGLSQVYGLMAQSGGTVRLSSAPGRGTEVSLVLPRASAEATAGSAAHADPDPTARAIPPTLALVVDDDEPVRQVAAEMLRDIGCDVREAPDGAQAIAMLSDPSFRADFLVFDYAMPGMNGLQLAAAVREMKIDAPILLITGYAEMATSAERDPEAIDGLLRKPFTIREMQTMMTRLRQRPRRSADGVVLRTTPRR
jgi:signal transduction histidine kinase/CheY-like chemotaxis protein